MDSQRTAHRRTRAGLRVASAAFAIAAAFGAIASTGDVTFAAKPNKPPKHDVKASLKKSVLTVTGTNSGETIVLRLRAGKPETIEVDVANDGSADFNFKTDKVQTIEVNANDGDDTLIIDESNGAFTDTIATTLNGDDGNDEIHGGSASETLNGGGGADTIYGGAGNDLITGGAGDDQVFGGDGNDRMIWNPGDGTDLLEGEGWTDVVEVNGSNGAETFTLTANGLRVRFDRLDPAPFSLDIGTTEYFFLNANDGNDQFSATGNLAALIHVSVEGGAGDDTLLGSNGVDVLHGGPGNDFIDGQQSNDFMTGGEGDDTFQWDPGDGSDSLDGQDGSDRLVFNGSNAAEIFDVAANGSRVRFTRNVGNIVMDVNRVERLEVNALGGTDTATVNDLSATDLAHATFSLASSSGTDDTEVDTVFANGTTGNDTAELIWTPSGSAVSGLGAVVEVTGEGAGDALVFDGLGGVDTAVVNGSNDAEVFTVTANGTRVRVDRLSPDAFAADIIAENLVINGYGGDDQMSAVGNLAPLTAITYDGGAGDDVLNGSNGADVIIGGDGNDTIDGQQGNDVVLMGAGDDTFIWDPGDGSDTVEGQDGFDTLTFNGSAANEIFDVAANGGRTRFTRNIANIVMDLDDVEAIDLIARGGTDSVVVNDLQGTDIVEITTDLGGADAAADNVIVNGTNGDDVILPAGDANGVAVLALAVQVNITGAEAANDRLTINALAGDDAVDASGVQSGSIQLTIDGGADDDVLIGGDGNDVILGGEGDDVLMGGPGLDILDGGPGDNVVIQ